MSSKSTRHSSEEETDLSESELEDYIDDIYRQLKKEKYQLKISKSTFKCPFCYRKRKQEYDYRDLVQHAKGIGRSSRGNLKEKGNHKALAEYLEKYHKPSIPVNSPEKPVSHAPRNKTEKYVWPWKGILANIPVRFEKGKFVGESGSKYRDDLTEKGFSPLKVIPLWNYKGHSGFAVVNFKQDQVGLANARSFEDFFELKGCGRRAWFTSRSRGNELYGWVAREEDYNLGGDGIGIVGKHLRDNGSVRSLEEIDAENNMMRASLISNLAKTVQNKENKTREIEAKYHETCAEVNKLSEEMDRMIHSFNEERQRMQKKTMESRRYLLDEHEMFKMKIESQKQQLDEREKHLEKREANFESEIVELRRHRKRNETAAVKQKKSDENLFRLMEIQEREKEELQKKIMSLQKEIDDRQVLELDIERLKGAAQVMEHMKKDAETLKKLEEIDKELKDKEEEWEDLDAMTQALIVKEKKTNDELQDARKELITGLSTEGTNYRTTIGVKAMGGLDEKLFTKAAKKKGLVPKAFIAYCRSLLDDHDWYPFKNITEHGVLKAVIDEDDDKLKGLKEELGEEVCQALVTAMIELNEYNPSGRYPVLELWHLKEQRKASLAEGAEFIINKWKNKKK